MSRYTITNSERKRRSSRLKERWENGELGKTLITSEKLEEVKSLLLNGESVNDVATKCGISNRSVSRIKLGRGREHLISKTEIETMNMIKTSRNISDETILSIANKIIENQMNQKEIAFLHNVRPATVSRIKNGTSYRDVINSSLLQRMNAKGVGRRLSKEEKEEIIKLVFEGSYSMGAIAKKYNVHTSTISRIYKKSGISP